MVRGLLPCQGERTGAGVELMRGVLGPGVTGAFLLSGVAMLLLSGCRSAWLLVVHERP